MTQEPPQSWTQEPGSVEQRDDPRRATRQPDTPLPRTRRRTIPLTSIPPPPGPPTNGLAVASLILAILWIAWLGSALAVVFGHAARGQIRRTGENGDGLAIAGLVLGWIGIGTLVLGLVVSVVNGR